MELIIQPANKSDFSILATMDREIFGRDDAFSADNFGRCVNFLVYLNGFAIGSIVLMHNRSIARTYDDDEPIMEGSLYIISTALLPEYQRIGLGSILKAWQIAYARHNGFKRIVTNARLRNKASIALNKKFSFQVVETIPGYYPKPKEDAVVMRLDL